MGDRVDFVAPITEELLTAGLQKPKVYAPENYDPKVFENREYDRLYREHAAFFQYGWTAGARPVPFGKREITLAFKS